MLRIICYDIEDTKLRTKLSKYLLQKGFERIQKSVFLGQSNSGEYFKTWTGMDAIIKRMTKNEGLPTTDSIYSIALEEHALKKMHIIGLELDIDYICNRKRVLFI